MSTDELESRVSLLEEKADAVLGVLDCLLKKVYGPEFMSKVDKLVAYGKEED